MQHLEHALDEKRQQLFQLHLLEPRVDQAEKNRLR